MGDSFLMAKATPGDRHGAPDGIERLFWENHAGVFQAAYRITGSVADAEDVLQTVFLRLLARGGSVDLTQSPGGYLRRAAVNAALDAVRARGTRRTVSLELVPPEGLPARGPDAERDQEDRDARDMLRRALARLHPRTAEAFALKYLEGLDNAEIARALGTSRGVVAVVLFRARAQVRAQVRALSRERKVVS